MKMGILDLFRRWQENQAGKYRVRRRSGPVRTEILEVRRVLSPVVIVGSTMSINPTTTAPITVSNGVGGVSVNVDGANYGAYAGLTAINLTGTSGNDQITLSGTFTGINFNIQGNGGSDTLVAANTANTFNLSSGNAGTLNGNIVFSGIQNLQGGTASNTFNFVGGFISGNIVGGSSTNTLDYSNANSGVLVNLATGEATSVGGTISKITNVVGTTNLHSTLVGQNIINTWSITGADSGNINGSITFSNIDNIQGGRLANTFSFLGGFIRGNITGGLSSNSLDYTSTSSGILVNLGSGQTTSVGGTVSGITNVAGNPTRPVTLIGLNAANVWQITGANSGSFVDTPNTVIPTTITVTFSNITNLTGGTGTNAFTMQPGGSISGTIIGGTPVNGVLAPDWLDYSNYTTAVTVNLSTNSATNIGTVLNILGVRGGSGVNTLTGNANGNVLVGGAGNDTLNSGSGRSILIGGLGSDTLSGASGQDILIGGYTTYDLNYAALSAILAEWQSADSFATRVSDIRNGGGLNGSYVLVANQTVFGDSASNSLYDGAAVPNWLWGQPSELKNSNSQDVIDSPNLGPVILAGAMPAIFTVKGPAVPVAAGITLSDAESSTATSAVVQFTAGYVKTQDTLGFTATAATGNIVGAYNATTGTMTLTSAGGTATIAQFQAALQQVTFNNSGITPSTIQRFVSIRVYDGMAYSNTLSNTIGINYAPVLAGTSTTTFVPGGPAVAINSVLIVSDSNNTTLPSATVSFTGGTYQAGQDVLAFSGNATTGSLVGSFNATTGVLTLQSSGAQATLAQYQAALRLVTYQDTNAANPVSTPRTFAYQVSDGSALSNVINSTVNVGYGPVLGGTSSANYKLGTSAVVVNSNITAADLTSGTLNFATVSIGSLGSSSQFSEDILSFTGTAATGKIFGTYNSTTGVLTLQSSGALATVAQYQAALRLVTYRDSNSNTSLTSPRTITYQVNDGTKFSNILTSTVTIN